MSSIFASALFISSSNRLNCASNLIAFIWLESPSLMLSTHSSFDFIFANALIALTIVVLIGDAIIF
ncbi:unnamed protein product [Meloidogyne enterolobii]|uniref:Uncharacterized protein n=1 Tax=Meloidogyne enterolobii TaxID=390850 RepID=A0ACB0YA36_MELEN